MFAALTSAILEEVAAEARARFIGGKPQPVFEPGDSLVYVGFALARTHAMFLAFFAEVIAWEPVLQAFGLEGTGFELSMVGIRTANDFTGPTFLYAHVIRHPKYKDAVGQQWQPHMLYGGFQSDGPTLYVQLTRGSKSCRFCWRGSSRIPTRWHRRFRLAASRCHRSRLR